MSIEMDHSDAKYRKFQLVDEFVGIRLGVDLVDVRPGEVAVVETVRRLEPEKSFGHVRALWLIRLADGRCVASVPPGTGSAVEEILQSLDMDKDFLLPATIDRLRDCIDLKRTAAGLPKTDRILRDEVHACSSATLICHHFGDCRRLTDASISAAEDLFMPDHCFPDGLVYGVVEDNRIVSVAYAHRTGLMEDHVADIGIVTAAQYRGRGFAKTVVSAVFRHMTSSGGEGFYHCSPENTASMATARSVGCLPYGSSLILTAPAD